MISINCNVPTYLLSLLQGSSYLLGREKQELYTCLPPLIASQMQELLLWRAMPTQKSPVKTQILTHRRVVLKINQNYVSLPKQRLRQNTTQSISPNPSLAFFPILHLFQSWLCVFKLFPYSQKLYLRGIT